MPRANEYISDNPPGICSQKDFTHDWHILLDKLDEYDQMALVGLIEIAIKKGYRFEV